MFPDKQKTTTPVCIPDVALTDLPPLGLDTESLKEDFRAYFNHTLGRDKYCQSHHYKYEALAFTLRARLLERWNATRDLYRDKGLKRTYYLSLEFLMGRALGNAIINLGVEDNIEKSMQALCVQLEVIAEEEHDAGLGNGGLGRLAACFLDSCATLQLPVMGYGIRYEYGMFRQHIVNGEQIEEPDHWLRNGNSWEIERPEYTQRICFGGRTEFYKTDNGELRSRWVDTHDVLAVPYDMPIPGYQNNTVNTLRLWSASATDEFDLGEFNAGSYPESVASKNDAENITMVLYPNDTSENGKALRLKQQYFLASASLQDIFRRWEVLNENDFSNFADNNCFQMNDTHPTLAVAELMRLLLDEKKMSWDDAWGITTRTMAYTNHTLLPEALEKWPVHLFEELLPRLLEIIYEINARFISTIAKHWPGEIERQRRMSIIEEGNGESCIRMAHLAIVGSFSVNGVAALHTQLLIEGLFADFYALWPHKFSNKTNGVTPRRWLARANPALSALITDKIGKEWVTNLDYLSKLHQFKQSKKFKADWKQAKQYAKSKLIDLIKKDCSVEVDINMMFDVQVKRIHEYKRQLLNVLHIIYLYDKIKNKQFDNIVPRCIIIGGKAAPGYFFAKKVIKLINNVADVVNNDADVNAYLKVVFIPNYCVTAMEIIAPGTDLSEQISTAGKEASGTGNMKFMMNGAATIGTLDGANIEIREEVGADNFFLFGLTAEEVTQVKLNYDPSGIIDADEDFKRVMHLLESGHFNQFEHCIFDDISRSIRDPHDPWVTAADFRSYVDTQITASMAYKNQDSWTEMSISNTASSGKFSTDRTMMEYNRDIWKL